MLIEIRGQLFSWNTVMAIPSESCEGLKPTPLQDPEKWWLLVVLTLTGTPTREICRKSVVNGSPLGTHPLIRFVV